MNELEQYGWRLCIRIDSVPKENKEKAQGLFKSIKALIEEVPGLKIQEVVTEQVYYCFLYDLLSSYSILKSLKNSTDWTRFDKTVIYDVLGNINKKLLSCLA